MSKNIRLVMFLLFLYIPAFQAQADSQNISVTIFSETYSGKYNGSTSNNLPTGAGTFVCHDSASDFTLTGTWEDGLLQGDATIVYENNTVIECSFLNGIINGDVLETNSDGSYKEYSCSSGNPCGLILCYDSHSTLTDYDFYYQTQSINDLISDSADADYHALISATYSICPYRIYGTVLGVYDTDEYSYILLEDNSKCLYILTYKNTSFDKYNQAIFPNAISGDKIVAYGFLQKYADLSSITGLGLSTLISYPNDNATDAIRYEKNKDVVLPFIRVFAGKLQSQTPPDRLNVSYEYDSIIRYPYLYYNVETSLSGVITDMRIDYDQNVQYLYLDVDNTGKVLLIQSSFKENDLLPVTGNKIYVEGVYSGNHKILTANTEELADEDETEDTNGDTDAEATTYTDINSKKYTIYPLVTASSISITQ